MLSYLGSLFAYNRWANERVHNRLREINGPPDRVSAFMNHIIAAEYLWLGRLTGDRTAMAVWPDLSRAEQRQHVTGVADRWQAYLASRSEASLSEPIDYVNSKGERWQSRVLDVLMHVVMHSAYHRGQIASGLRDAGFEPAYTDFIEAVRRGEVEVA